MTDLLIWPESSDSIFCKDREDDNALYCGAEPKTMTLKEFTDNQT